MMFNFCSRHTDEMISNLQSAGLGFHVDATNTKDKFGKIFRYLECCKCTYAIISMQ